MIAGMSPREGRDGETASRQEREVKLRVADAGQALEALLAAGASPEGPWQLEDDRLLDDARRSVHSADCVLRVRRMVGLDPGEDEAGGEGGPATGLITWKGPARIEDG